MSVLASSANGALKALPRHPNYRILDMLSSYRQAETTSKHRNTRHLRNLSKAIVLITKTEEPIHHDSDPNLRYISPNIRKYIRNHLEGFPDRYVIDPEERAREEEEHTKIRSLRAIDHLGEASARALLEAGCTSISDLNKKEYYDQLGLYQKIAFRYYGQLATPITRAESESVLEFVKEHTSSDFTIELVGRYRRKKEESGTISLMFTHPAYAQTPPPRIPPDPPKTNLLGRDRKPFHTPSWTYYTPVEQIRTCPLMTDILAPLEARALIAATYHRSIHKFEGITLLPYKTPDGLWEDTATRQRRLRSVLPAYRNTPMKGQHRRMVITFVPWECRGAALLHLTGDIQYNRDLYQKALSMGLFINEYGLWRWHPSQTDSASAYVDKVGIEAATEAAARQSFPVDTEETVGRRSFPPDAEEKQFRHLWARFPTTQAPLFDDIGNWELITAHTEEAIVEYLGLPWVPPEMRNYFVRTNNQRTRRFAY